MLQSFSDNNSHYMAHGALAYTKIHTWSQRSRRVCVVHNSFVSRTVLLTILLTRVGQRGEVRAVLAVDMPWLDHQTPCCSVEATLLNSGLVVFRVRIQDRFTSSCWQTSGYHNSGFKNTAGTLCKVGHVGLELVQGLNKKFYQAPYRQPKW